MASRDEGFCFDDAKIGTKKEAAKKNLDDFMPVPKGSEMLRFVPKSFVFRK